MRKKILKAQRVKKPAVAAFLSLIFWGSGQFYNGQFLKGCLFLFTNILILPWMYSIFDAYVTCRRHNDGEIKQAQPRRWYVALLVWFIMAGFTALMILWGWTWFIGQTRYDYNLLAQNYLLEVAVGSENFAKDHNGNYPEKIDVLLYSKPPYLRRNLCGQSYSGFIISCFFYPVGYRVEAVPIEGAVYPGLKSHAIITGGKYTDSIGNSE